MHVDSREMVKGLQDWIRQGSSALKFGFDWINDVHMVYIIFGINISENTGHWSVILPL